VIGGWMDDARGIGNFTHIFPESWMRPSFHTIMFT
jgi:hypothetical protein